MTKKTTIYDSAAYLDSDDAINAYVEDALESDDPAFVTHALGVVARARGMAKIAKKTGLSRASLYKALRADGNPEFGTIMRVMSAIGLRLQSSKATIKPGSKPILHKAAVKTKGKLARRRIAI